MSLGFSIYRSVQETKRWWRRLVARGVVASLSRKPSAHHVGLEACAVLLRRWSPGLWHALTGGHSRQSVALRADGLLAQRGGGGGGGDRDGDGDSMPSEVPLPSRAVNGPNVVPFRTPLGRVAIRDPPGRCGKGCVKGPARPGNEDVRQASDACGSRSLCSGATEATGMVWGSVRCVERRLMREHRRG